LRPVWSGLLPAQPELTTLGVGPGETNGAPEETERRDPAARAVGAQPPSLPRRLTVELESGHPHPERQIRVRRSERDGDLLRPAVDPVREIAAARRPLEGENIDDF
jgi:hypothetical protein